jgi:hypothetical protein
VLKHTPVDIESLPWDTLARVVTGKQKVKEGLVVEVGLRKGARRKLCRDPHLLEFMNRSKNAGGFHSVPQRLA